MAELGVAFPVMLADQTPRKTKVPNPDYEAKAFEFDDEWYESASPEELSTAVKEAINDGIEKTNAAVVAKYQALQGDLMQAFAQPGQDTDAAPAS